MKNTAAKFVSAIFATVACRQPPPRRSRSRGKGRATEKRRYLSARSERVGASRRPLVLPPRQRQQAQLLVPRRRRKRKAARKQVAEEDAAPCGKARRAVAEKAGRATLGQRCARRISAAASIRRAGYQRRRHATACGAGRRAARRRAAQGRHHALARTRGGKPASAAAAGRAPSRRSSRHQPQAQPADHRPQTHARRQLPCRRGRGLPFRRRALAKATAAADQPLSTADAADRAGRRAVGDRRDRQRDVRTRQIATEQIAAEAPPVAERTDAAVAELRRTDRFPKSRFPRSARAGRSEPAAAADAGGNSEARRGLRSGELTAAISPAAAADSRTNSVRPMRRSRFSRSALRIDCTSANASSTFVIDDDVVVLRPVADSWLARSMRPRITSSESCARVCSRFSRSAADGGRMNTLTTSARAFSRNCWVPCQSMSNSTSRPADSAASTGARGVP